MQPACTHLAWLPDADVQAFGHLTEAARRQVSALCDHFATVASAPEGKVARLQRLAKETGHAFGTLRRLYYAFVAHGWRGVMDGRTAKREAERLPEKFIAYWQDLCAGNQRKCRPQWRELQRRWAAGHEIPGYGTWRDWWRATRNDAPPRDATFVPPLPKGWTYANLMRPEYRPTKFSLVATRQGLVAASEYRPKLLSTRVGLQVGMRIVFDDVELDTKVNVLGWTSRPVRPISLGAQCVFSASRFNHAVRPVLVKHDGTKDKIKDIEMRFFTASTLINYGYHPDGAVLMVEHGTAAISEAMERVIFDHTGGRVRVDRSGLNGKHQLPHLFEGESRGNPRFKATLESLHNLMHNELAALPGQVGNGRDNCPEHLAGFEKQNLFWAQVMAELPPQYAAQLRPEGLSWAAFRRLSDTILRLIDERTDHELEGWAECGHLAQEIQLFAGAPWMPMSQVAALPPDQRAAVLAVAGRPGATRTVRLSPAQVYRRAAPGLARLPLSTLPSLLGEIGRREVDVKDDQTIQFDDITMGPGTFEFLGELHDLSGAVRVLCPGEKFLAYHSPFDLETLALCDAKGRFAGFVKANPRGARADLESLTERYKTISRVTAKLADPLRRAGAKAMRERIADAEHNAAVLAAATKGQRPSSLRARPGVKTSAEDLAAATRGRPNPAAQAPTADDLAAMLRPRTK